MSQILVLEDFEESFILIKNAIDGHHSLTWVKSVSEAMRAFNRDFELALVDIELPDGDGFQFCDWVRSQKHLSHIPIMFISGKSSVESRITGFSIGGDDYITKPFNFVELKARVEAKLRWSSRRANYLLNANGIGVDLRSQRAQMRVDSKIIDLDLTPIEFKILNMFLTEPNKAFSRDEILNRIWGQTIFVYPRSVDTHVSKLRSKLGPKANCIKSVHGIGYKFTLDERASASSDEAGNQANSLFSNKDLRKNEAASIG